MVGLICHVFPGTLPSKYMDIPPSPRALNFDGKLAVQVLKALNPNPDESDRDSSLARQKVNAKRSKINKRDPYTKKAIERRGLKI